MTAEKADQGVHPDSKPDPKTGEYVLWNSDQAKRRLFTKVGADGTFAIHDVPPGTYVVHTFSPPYLSPDDTIYPTSNSQHVAMGPQTGSSATRIQITPARPNPHIDLALKLGGVIEDTVRMAEGAAPSGSNDPLLGLEVDAERKLGPNQYARTGGAAHADAAGHYRLEALAPGDYIVSSAPPLTMVRSEDGSSRAGSGLPIYAPHTVRPSQATIAHHRLGDAPPGHRCPSSHSAVPSRRRSRYRR